ncbi:MAG: PadR family transcriptional regulator [Streptosporangiales bacterium]|nr:PadR family transcriptional regulator [Streptosporangiales bacterium]
MSLRHALLALLTARPMTGYDLAKQFDQSVAYVWHAPHSQIYPELRRLEASGLVSAESVARGNRATKRTYRITEEGRAELERWVKEVTPPPLERDAARLKATYFEFGSLDNARRQFRAHLAHYERRRIQWEAHVAELENRATALLRRRLAEAPEHLHDAIVAYKVHVYRGLVEHARLEVEWARRGLDLVGELADKLDAAAPTPRSTRSRSR